MGLKSLAAAGAQELRFDKETWSKQLGPICQLWANIFKVDTYRQIRITQNEMTTKDPVDQFVYLEMTAIKAILEKVHENI